MKRTVGLLLAMSSPAQAAEPIDDQALRKALVEELRSFEPGLSLVEMLEKPLDPVQGLALPPAHKKALDPVEIHQQLLQSTLVFGVLYRCQKCGKDHLRTASAFVLAPGLAVTNHHVLANDGIVAAVMTRDGRMARVAGVVAMNEAADLAVVRVDFIDLDDRPGIPLAPELPETGSSVFVVSHPAKQYFTFSAGRVSRISRDPTKGVVVQISAPFAHGSSGAPVVDPAGNLVAIVSSTRSIYAEHDDGDDQLQMVIRNTIAATALGELVAPAAGVESPASGGPDRVK